MDGQAERGGVQAPGLGESQRGVLEALKREGARTVPELARALALNVETLRSHLRALEGHGLVRRAAKRTQGRGRPEILYALTPAAESLFPRREGEVLQGLARHLATSGHEALLRDYFEDYIGGRREAALARVAGLAGRARLEASARVLTELGFMAEVLDGEAGPQLRLSHCPLREVVEVTRIPCGVEIGFVRELVGEELTRVSYMPAGGHACAYRADVP